MDNSILKYKLKAQANEKSPFWRTFVPLSQYHQCCLTWSDKCAHCEIGFDDVAQRISMIRESSEQTHQILKEKIEYCSDKLKGMYFIILYI